MSCWLRRSAAKRRSSSSLVTNLTSTTPGRARSWSAKSYTAGSGVPSATLMVRTLTRCR